MDMFININLKVDFSQSDVEDVALSWLQTTAATAFVKSKIYHCVNFARCVQHIDKLKVTY